VYHFKCKNSNHPIFTTTADALYNGEHWCPYCSGRSGNFYEELSKICQSKDGELLSDYIDASTHITIKCNKHDYVWDMLPSNIKKGRWCPICNMDTFTDLVGENNEKLKYDFALLDKNDNLVYLVEVDDEEHKDKHFGNSPRQIQRQQAVTRDRIKDNYCKTHNIPLYRMEVPFRCFNKWDYEDYYRYINAELKEIVNKSRGGIHAR